MCAFQKRKWFQTYGFPPGIPDRLGGRPGTRMWWWGSNPTWGVSENVRRQQRELGFPNNDHSLKKEKKVVSKKLHLNPTINQWIKLWLSVSLTYHLRASVRCDRCRRHGAHLRGDVVQARVGGPCSAQLSVYGRVGNHSKRTRVRAGHRQRCAQAGRCRNTRSLYCHLLDWHWNAVENIGAVGSIITHTAILTFTLLRTLSV